MPTIIEKSARSSMWLKGLHCLVAIVVSVALAAVVWALDDFFVSLVVGVFIVIGLLMAGSALRQMLVYARATGAWRVVIDADHLVWESPNDEWFQTFRLQLENIARVQGLLVPSGGTQSRSSKKEFYIHLKNGRTMQIPVQQGGVTVAAVFEELHKRGIAYRYETVRFEQFNQLKKGWDILPMHEWPRQ